MKRTIAIPFVALTTVGLLASFVSQAQASASQTRACTGCHSQNAAVTISAVQTANNGVNATYNVTANNPWGQNAWAVFSGSTKTAGAAGSGSAAVVLPVGKTYTVYGVSGNGNGTEGYAVVSVTPSGPTPSVPAAPALNATYNTSTNSITISWAAVAGATSYDYQRGTGAVTNTTATSVTLTGLAAGATAFRLRAVNGAGASAYTSASVVYAPPAVPSAPVLNSTYNTSANSVTISWAAVGGATSYDYQLGTGLVINTTGTSVTLSGLAVGTTAFKVRAVNGTGASAYANANIIYTVPVQAPGTPTLNSTYNTSDGSVTILWTAASGAASYDYQVGSGAVLNTTATSVTLNGLAVGTTSFRLRARNAIGTSTYRTASIVYTLPQAPGTPALNSTYNTSDGSVTIAWTAVSGAASYDYQVGNGAVLNTTATSVTLNGLAVGTTSFRLRAVNTGGRSGYRTASIVCTLAAPGAPVLPAGYVTSTGGITITWAAVAGATRYEYRTAGGTIATINATAVTLSGLPIGDTVFEVRAVNSGGASAFALATITCVVPAPEPPALDAFYKSGAGSVTISWAPVAGATAYEYQVESGAVVRTASTSVTLTDLSVGSTAFALRACGAGGAGWWTTTTLMFAPPDPAPVLAKPSVKVYAKRRLTVRGSISGLIPEGSRVTISVYVKNPRTKKYRKYTYRANWVPSADGNAFVTKIRPPRTGKAYIVVSSNGVSAKTRAFTIRK